MRAAMAAELEGRPIPDGNPNQWADRTKNHIQFDYDAYAEVERWWASGGREQIEALGRHSGGGLGSRVKRAFVKWANWLRSFRPLQRPSHTIEPSRRPSLDLPSDSSIQSHPGLQDSV